MKNEEKVVLPNSVSASQNEAQKYSGIHCSDDSVPDSECISFPEAIEGEKEGISCEHNQPIKAEKSEEEHNQSDVGFSGLQWPFAFLGFSKVGESHIKRGVECQDKSKIEVIEKDNKKSIILAIADGLGSCEHSDVGAEIATRSAVETIADSLSTSSKQLEEIAIETIKTAMNKAYELVELEAERYSESSDLYCSTLTVVLFDGNTLYIGHAGDDGVVALSNRGYYALVTARHKGDEINSVFPLQSKTTWEFLKVRDIMGVVLATDGVLDSLVRSESEDWRVFFPILQPLITRDKSDEEKVRELKNDYIRYMDSDSYRSIVSDDITFLAAINVEASKIVQFKEFSVDDWVKKTKQYGMEYYKKLYPEEAIPDNIVGRGVLRDQKLLEGIPSAHDNSELQKYFSNNIDITPEGEKENEI